MARSKPRALLLTVVGVLLALAARHCSAAPVAASKPGPTKPPAPFFRRVESLPLPVFGPFLVNRYSYVSLAPCAAHETFLSGGCRLVHLPNSANVNFNDQSMLSGYPTTFTGGNLPANTLPSAYRCECTRKTGSTDRSYLIASALCISNK